MDEIRSGKKYASLVPEVLKVMTAKDGKEGKRKRRCGKESEQEIKNGKKELRKERRKEERKERRKE